MEGSTAGLCCVDPQPTSGLYCNEIRRGLGQYTLSSEFSSLATDRLSLEYIPAQTPEEIVQGIIKREVPVQGEKVVENEN